MYLMGAEGACSVLELGVDVGAVNGGVATGGPAAALPHKRGVVHLADEEVAGSALGLRVALQAEVGVMLHEQLGVNGSVRVVANGAAFAHGLVFEDELAGLLLMALRAGLVHLSQAEAAGGLHHVVTMRVVALHAVQVTFEDRVMVGQAKLGVNILVTAEAGFRGLLGIEDEFVQALSAGGHMAAAGAVTRLATGVERAFGRADLDARMGIGGKLLMDGGVAIHACLVADELRAFDMQRFVHGARDGGAGSRQEKSAGEQSHGSDVQPALKCKAHVRQTGKPSANDAFRVLASLGD